MTAIKHNQLKELAASGGVSSVTIIGEPIGFALNIDTNNGTKLLTAKTGQTRLFKKLETLLDYLKIEIGIVRATINFESWNSK